MHVKHADAFLSEVNSFLHEQRVTLVAINTNGVVTVFLRCMHPERKHDMKGFCINRK